MTIKVCPSCNKEHDLTKPLKLIGIQEIDGHKLELFNCSCGSTLVGNVKRKE